VLTSQAVVSVDPEAKRSAPYYLNISWVQHIEVLHITQDEIVSGRRACWTRTWENSLHPNFGELRKGERLRMPLPRTRVSKGIEGRLSASVVQRRYGYHFRRTLDDTFVSTESENIPNGSSRRLKL
jgi:hypothetical protein